LVVPVGVAVDLVNNELVVANIGGESITVYSRTASGNTAPLRTLQGAAAELSGPVGVTVTTDASPPPPPPCPLSEGSEQGETADCTPLPAAAVSLNGSAFRMGQRGTYQATLTPGSTAIQVDIYLGVLLPDGVTFLSIIPQPPGVSFVVGFSALRFLANTTILSKFGVAFSYTFIGFEPAGRYIAYAVLVRAGSNSLEAANVLSFGFQEFEFIP